MMEGEARKRIEKKRKRDTLVCNIIYYYNTMCSSIVPMLIMNTHECKNGGGEGSEKEEIEKRGKMG
jgi:hypothetical protein